MITTKKPVAILGGSFDPIHNGHLHVANAVWQALDLDHVLFMPTGNSPFKATQSGDDKRHRLAMVELAVNGIQHYQVSELEISQPGRTYTVDTLRTMKQDPRYADRELYFVLGYDVLASIYAFREPLALFGLCQFVLVDRGACTYPAAVINQMLADGAVVHHLHIPAMTISSQAIRSQVHNKQLLVTHVPPAVAYYMEAHQLYQPEIAFDIEAHTARLKQQVSSELFTHIMGVCDTARALARHYRVNETSAHIGALLHDWCKEYTTEELLAVGVDHGYTPDVFIRESMHICHGFLSATMGPETFGITNEDILNAVRYHTVGRANMSLLEKIVFIADATEPNRGNGADLQALRELTYSNIDRAMYMALKFNFDKACRRGFIFHPLALEALTYYRQSIEEI